MLADEQHRPVPVERDDPRSEESRMHDAVDAALPVRPDDLIVVDRDPLVLVGETATPPLPRSDPLAHSRKSDSSSAARSHEAA